MTEYTIIAVRVILVALALSALGLNWRGPWRMFRGSQSTVHLAKSQVFFVSLSVLIGQTFYLVYSEPLVLLAALLFMTTGLTLALALSVRARQRGLRKLDKLVDRPDLALALVELAEMDEEVARQMAQDARRLSAEMRRQK